jgi:hypothetical protein
LTGGNRLTSGGLLTAMEESTSAWDKGSVQNPLFQMPPVISAKFCVYTYQKNIFTLLKEALASCRVWKPTNSGVVLSPRKYERPLTARLQGSPEENRYVVDDQHNPGRLDFEKKSWFDAKVHS